MNNPFVKCLVPAALLGMIMLPLAAQAQQPYPSPTSPGNAHPRSVNGRLENQHDRIQQGVQSDQLTRGEANRLRYRDARIHRQERIDRRMNGGHLTAAERQRLQGRLNRTSGLEYGLKHNDRTRR